MRARVRWLSAMLLLALASARARAAAADSASAAAPHAGMDHALSLIHI